MNVLSVLKLFLLAENLINNLQVYNWKIQILNIRLYNQVRGIVFRMYEYFKREAARSSCTTCASASNVVKCQERTMTR